MFREMTTEETEEREISLTVRLWNASRRSQVSLRGECSGFGIVVAGNKRVNDERGEWNEED